MKNIWRGAILILLLASTITTFSLFAQETSSEGTITGSKIVSDLLAILTQDSGSEQSLTAQPNGTSAGFTVFCTSDADMTGATRAMTADEEVLCTQNGITYREFLLGYDALAIIVHPGLSFVECLTNSQLNPIFAPSATNSVLDWSLTGIVDADTTPLTVYLPSDDSSLYVLLDNSVNGFGLRADATVENDSAVVVESVKNTAGAIGVVPASAVTADSGVKVVNLGGGCIAPSAETLEDGDYPFGTPLYLYVNTTAVDIVRDALTFAFSDDGVASIVNAGYVYPTTDARETNRTILIDNTLVGRQFTKEVTAFRIPDNIFGTVTFGGNSALKTTFDNITRAFSSQYPSVTVTAELQGQNVAVRRYCNGELDFITVATRTPNAQVFTEDQALGCQNTIGTSLTYDLGKNAVVLVANGDLRQTPQPSEDAGYNICLTVDQVLRIWATNPENPAVNWNMVSDSLPDLELQLIAPLQDSSDLLDDLLMTKVGSPTLIIREDIAETNDDVKYRATAVSLVQGLTTYMSWQDYQTAVQVEGANLQLVAVDGGNGCVVPSAQTIADMSYPYTINHQLVIPQNALARSEVQGFVWLLFQEGVYQQFGFVERDDLADFREVLQTAFTDAITASLTPETTPSAEVTPDAEVETTPEAETTPALDITPEVETTPAPDITPEAETTPAS